MVNPAAKILMKYPAFSDRDPVTTTRNAFDRVWSKKGWVEYNPAATRAVEAKKSSEAVRPRTPQTPTPKPESPATVAASNQQASQTPASAGKEK